EVECPTCRGRFRADAVPVATPARPRRRRRQRHRRGDECHWCGSREPFIPRQEMGQTGWIVFVVLLIFFFPLCWLALFVQERFWVCADCGARQPGYYQGGY